MSAAQFSEQLRAWQAKVEANSRTIFVNTASAAKDSITDGSPITGAPGSPVDTGALKASWNLSFPSPTEALISTNVEYAQHVEDNVRGVTFRVGGPHSVRLTAQNIDKLLAVETAKVTGA